MDSRARRKQLRTLMEKGDLLRNAKETDLDDLTTCADCLIAHTAAVASIRQSIVDTPEEGTMGAKLQKTLDKENKIYVQLRQIYRLSKRTLYKYSSKALLDSSILNALDVVETAENAHLEETLKNKKH